MPAKQPDDIFSVLKPGDGSRLTMERELQRRADRFQGTFGHRYYYMGIGDFLTEHGTLYQGNVAWPVPDAYKQFVGRTQWCFRNAFNAAKVHPELRYCEGLYMVGLSGTNHAWCLDPDDRVIELTLPIDEMAEGIGTRVTRGGSYSKQVDDPNLWVYYGAVLPLDRVAEAYTRLGMDPDNPEASVPVLDDAFADDNEGDEVWGVDDPAPIFKRPWRP